MMTEVLFQEMYQHPGDHTPKSIPQNPTPNKKKSLASTEKNKTHLAKKGLNWIFFWRCGGLQSQKSSSPPESSTKARRLSLRHRELQNFRSSAVSMTCRCSLDPELWTIHDKPNQQSMTILTKTKINPFISYHSVSFFAGLRVKIGNGESDIEVQKLKTHIFYLIFGKVSTFSLLSRTSFKAGIWILIWYKFGRWFPSKSVMTSSPRGENYIAILQWKILAPGCDMRKNWLRDELENWVNFRCHNKNKGPTRDEGNLPPTSSWHLLFFSCNHCKTSFLSCCMISRNPTAPCIWLIFCPRWHWKPKL